MESNRLQTQRTLANLSQDTYLLTWIESFLIDRKASGAASGTLRFYRQKLDLFSRFCDSQAVTSIAQITPDLLRQFMLRLESTGHNKGGVHGAYRAVRALLR